MSSEAGREPSKSVYRFLEAAFAGGGLVVRESGVDCPEGSIRHAIDAAGKRVLLIPVSEEEYDAFVDDSAGSSVSLRRERYAGDGTSVRPFLVFRCEPAFLSNTFASFVDDVLDEFAGAGPEASPSATTRVILEKWRRLFATRGPGLLNDKNLVGLAAELRIVSELVNERGAAAFEAWTGPDGGDHDLVLPNCSIEVKGTQRKSGMEVEINGLGQLSRPVTGELFLAAARVAFSPNGAVTVPGLVDSILELGVDREAFSQKLEAVGYHHARADEYERKRMDFLEDRFFRIGEKFPRIERSTIADVPQSDRIRNVSYLLDLTSHDTIEGAMDVDDIPAFLGEVL